VAEERLRSSSRQVCMDAFARLESYEFHVTLEESVLVVCVSSINVLC
jgi:hypothetical protein